MDFVIINAPVPNARNITFSCFLKNGNILFATRTKMYLSGDDLKTQKLKAKMPQVRQRLQVEGPGKVSRNFGGSEEPHSSAPELWNIDGTEVDLNANYSTGACTINPTF